MLPSQYVPSTIQVSVHFASRGHCYCNFLLSNSEAVECFTEALFAPHRQDMAVMYLENPEPRVERTSGVETREPIRGGHPAGGGGMTMEFFPLCQKTGSGKEV